MAVKERVTYARGKHTTIPKDKVPGRLLVETDTGDVFLDDTVDKRLQLTDNRKQDKFGNVVTEGNTTTTEFFTDNNQFGFSGQGYYGMRKEENGDIVFFVKNSDGSIAFEFNLNKGTAQFSGLTKFAEIPDPKLDKEAANKKYVDSKIAEEIFNSKAMIYKGEVNSTHNLPVDGYKTGWTYTVSEKGTFANVPCEIGDLIIALNDGLLKDGYDVIAEDWTVIQTNIEGAVTADEIFGNSEVILGTGDNKKVKSLTKGKEGQVVKQTAESVVWGEDNNTQYTFTNGEDGSFTVTNTDSPEKSQKVDIGIPKLARGKVGDESHPIYIDENGIPTALEYEILTSVPENAVFTDTTYEVFRAATSDTEGIDGLVPAPDEDEINLFLRSDGQWIKAVTELSDLGIESSAGDLNILQDTEATSEDLQNLHDLLLQFENLGDISKLTDEINNKAPKEHSSESKEYGIADYEKYGHIRIDKNTDLEIEEGILSHSTQPGSVHLPDGGTVNTSMLMCKLGGRGEWTDKIPENFIIDDGEIIAETEEEKKLKPIKSYDLSETVIGEHTAEEFIQNCVITITEKIANVAATFNYAENFSEFSSDETEQSGYYFPVHLGDGITGENITVESYSGNTKTIPFDADWILRVQNNESWFKFSIDNIETVTFEFSDSYFREKEKVSVDTAMGNFILPL